MCTKWNLNDGKFGVRFATAKSRVAPLKELSIPRLVRVDGRVDPAVVSYNGHMPLFCHVIIGYPCSSPAMHIKQAIQESQQPLPKSHESTG